MPMLMMLRNSNCIQGKNRKWSAYWSRIPQIFPPCWSRTGAWLLRAHRVPCQRDTLLPVPVSRPFWNCLISWIHGFVSISVLCNCRPKRGSDSVWHMRAYRWSWLDRTDGSDVSRQIFDFPSLSFFNVCLNRRPWLWWSRLHACIQDNKLKIFLFVFFW
jgi:hypothetical protein